MAQFQLVIMNSPNISIEILLSIQRMVQILTAVVVFSLARWSSDSVS